MDAERAEARRVEGSGTGEKREGRDKRAKRETGEEKRRRIGGWEGGKKQKNLSTLAKGERNKQ